MRARRGLRLSRRPSWLALACAQEDSADRTVDLGARHPCALLRNASVGPPIAAQRHAGEQDDDRPSVKARMRRLGDEDMAVLALSILLRDS